MPTNVPCPYFFLSHLHMAFWDFWRLCLRPNSDRTGGVARPNKVNATALMWAQGCRNRGGYRISPRFWWLINLPGWGGRLYPPYYHLSPRFSDLPTSLLSRVALRCLYLERIATTHTKWSSRRATEAHWIIWVQYFFIRGMEHRFHWILCYISLPLFFKFPRVLFATMLVVSCKCFSYPSYLFRPEKKVSEVHLSH